MKSEPSKQNKVRNRLHCNGEMILQRLERIATGCIEWDRSFIKTCEEIFMLFPSMTCHLRCGHFSGLTYRKLLSSSNHTCI